MALHPAHRVPFGLTVTHEKKPGDRHIMQVMPYHFPYGSFRSPWGWQYPWQT